MSEGVLGGSNLPGLSLRLRGEERVAAVRGGLRRCGHTVTPDVRPDRAEGPVKMPLLSPPPSPGWVLCTKAKVSSARSVAPSITEQGVSSAQTPRTSYTWP